MRRINRLAAAIAGATLITAASVPAGSSHHAMVMYDGTKTVTLDGNVVEFRWISPHVFLKVDGRAGEAAPSEIWVLETSSPVNLARLGTWSDSLLKPGDRVRVEINPHRETDRKEARLMKLTIVDTGVTIGTAYRGVGQPAPGQ